jgi:xylulokinase
MTDLILAFDLGTGGCKASLYEYSGACRGTYFCPYATRYPRPGWHEQRPEDWWSAVVESTRALISSSSVESSSIRSIGISGFSLGLVPLDKKNELLLEWLPIWSDSRSLPRDTETVFRSVPEEKWYYITGNGFPASLYTVFKIIWLRNENPGLFAKTRVVIGTKDYINFLLTGVIATDHSYASGSGIYDLKKRRYSEELVAASGLEPSLFPEILPSSHVLGTLTPAAATALGLRQDVAVVAGGVDNSCMALGARNITEGSLYNSLGSSSWIAVTSAQPLTDAKRRPYVFEHVIPGMYNSATAIFSAGTSYVWMLTQICRDLADPGDSNAIFRRSEALAMAVPIGSNGVIFNPSLAGGSSLDESPHITGAWLGLTLRHTRDDLIRATLEGICMGLKRALDFLSSVTTTKKELILVGGGAKSALWRQMLADVYNVTVLKTSVDQQAAALGAAALAAVGTGAWVDFSRIADLHDIRQRHEPDRAASDAYSRLMPRYEEACTMLSSYGDLLHHTPQ